MNDSEIREGLKRKVLRHHIENEETLVLDEVGLRHGMARIDILVINGYLHGYELKSDKDTLRRLDNQIRVYCSVLDKVTIVTGQKHLSEALRIVPDWWGIKIAQKGPKGGIIFSEIRKPKVNPSQDPIAIAKLLWRDEALQYLSEIGQDEGLRSKTRRTIYKRLGDTVDLTLLKERVRNQLKNRKEWRSAAQ